MGDLAWRRTKRDEQEGSRVSFVKTRRGEQCERLKWRIFFAARCQNNANPFR